MFYFHSSSVFLKWEFDQWLHSAFLFCHLWKECLFMPYGWQKSSSLDDKYQIQALYYRTNILPMANQNHCYASCIANFKHHVNDNEARLLGLLVDYLQ